MGAHPFIHEEGIGYSLWKQPMFWTSSVRVSLQLLCTLAAVSSDGGRRRDGAAVPGPPVQVTPRVSRALKLGRVVPSEAVLCPGATRLVLQNWVGSQGACPPLLSPLLCQGRGSTSPVPGQPGSAAGAGWAGGFLQVFAPNRSSLQALRAACGEPSCALAPLRVAAGAWHVRGRGHLPRSRARVPLPCDPVTKGTGRGESRTRWGVPSPNASPTGPQGLECAVKGLQRREPLA